MDYVVSLVCRAFVPGKSTDIRRLILRMGLQILETELLTHYHQSKICFGYDCYWVKADLRSLIWARSGGRIHRAHVRYDVVAGLSISEHGDSLFPLRGARFH